MADQQVLAEMKVIMAVPDYQSLMLPVLSLSADGEIGVRNVVERLADQLGLDQAERSEIP